MNVERVDQYVGRCRSKGPSRGKNRRLNVVRQIGACVSSGLEKRCIFQSLFDRYLIDPNASVATMKASFDDNNALPSLIRLAKPTSAADT